MSEATVVQLGRRTANEQPVLDQQRVYDFLTRHPDFFNQCPDLLEQLPVQNEAGETISFAARQLERLRQSNRALEQQLKQLTLIARDNHELSSKMHQLTLALFKAEGLPTAVTTLTDTLRDSFNAELVGIRLISKEAAAAVEQSLFVAADDPQLALFEKVFESGQPRCGHVTAEQIDFLFCHRAADFDLQSCAIIPLQHDTLNGLLAIGSSDRNRFHPGQGDLFLAQMGELTAARLNQLT